VRLIYTLLALCLIILFASFASAQCVNGSCRPGIQVQIGARVITPVIVTPAPLVGPPAQPFPGCACNPDVCPGGCSCGCRPGVRQWYLLPYRARHRGR
jgi:hypothetical protein